MRRTAAAGCLAKRLICFEHLRENREQNQERLEQRQESTSKRALRACVRKTISRIIRTIDSNPVDRGLNARDEQTESARRFRVALG